MALTAMTARLAPTIHCLSNRCWAGPTRNVPEKATATPITRKATLPPMVP